MQADVILKEPPSWVPPLSLSGGARVEGGGGPRPPSYTPAARSNPELPTLCLIHYLDPHVVDDSGFELVAGGRESRVPQIVITATQICFAESALLNW